MKPPFNKTLDKTYTAYPAVLTISEESIEREAYQFAEFIETLKTQGVISDYSHVALLLHSVKPYLSGKYIEALGKKNIPSFCPRARTYFEQDEVRLMIGCFAQLFGYKEQHNSKGTEDETIADYMQECQKLLNDVCATLPMLAQELALLDTHVTFHTFLRLLHADGVNQRENPQQMIPVGHVQIMTIHQAKGLEFPVVVVGRLDKPLPQAQNEDRELKRFYHKQPLFEPEACISGFDLETYLARL